MSSSNAMLIPTGVSDITPEFLTDLIAARYPGNRIREARILDFKDFDALETSSSARACIEVEYSAGGVRNLPNRLIAKMTQSDTSLWYSNLHAMYANELAFYHKLRPELDLEAPRSLGGRMAADGRYILLLEDVSARGAKFHTVLDDEVTVDHVRHVLDTMARLHARYWESPRFSCDLSWVGSHVHGDLEALMRRLIGAGISSELKLRKFKRELLGIIGMNEDELRTGAIAVKEHQANLPCTLLHGDSHLGNMYFLPDGAAGLLDWQLMVKGNIAHDLGYHIPMALAIETRRREERGLLDFYLEKLREYGVTNPPDRETLWLEYRRAAIWGIYFGWLTVPAENYGWEYSFVAHLRVVTAFLDHGTAQLVKELS